MKIQKLTIDDKELTEAVQMFLKTKGIEMPIHSVEKPHSWSKESEVTFEFEVEPDEPRPAIPVKEEA